MKNPERLKIVIAGGGTAGWMAAAALGKLMSHRLSIRLIESDQIGTVGVGESTIPTMQVFHRLLGIDERTFMRQTNATFKLGIRFEGWKEIGSEYFHSFGTAGKDTWAAEFQHFWLRAKKLGIADAFGSYSIELQAAAAKRFAAEFEPRLNYAYHLDATAYAKYLREMAEKNGVIRTEGKIKHIKLDEHSGHIRSLILESGEEVGGDLFVDCTGFRALLMEGALHTGYEDWSHWLPCNGAVAVQTESVEDPVPFTRAIAHSFGWQWRIPLQHRVGNGLVFCSDYCSAEEAKGVLLNNIKGAPLSEPRLISFKTGKRRKSWNKNCVAIGLSSGFLEPLESTSIHLISSAILRLIRLIPIKEISEEDVNEFNRQMDVEMAEVRDFIILHYKVNNRGDSNFWNYCRQMEVPEKLHHRLAMYEQSARIFRAPEELFTINSWNQVMLGQGITPREYHPIADITSEADLREYFDKMRRYINEVVSRLPTHADYLKSYCNSGVMQ